MKDKIKALLDRAVALIRDEEPTRAIGYAAGVIVYFVARASVSFPDISFEDAVILTAAYLGTVGGVIETIRKIVWSPNSVDELIQTILADEKLAEAGEAALREWLIAQTTPAQPDEQVEPSGDSS